MKHENNDVGKMAAQGSLFSSISQLFSKTTTHPSKQKTPPSLHGSLKERLILEEIEEKN